MIYNTRVPKTFLLKRRGDISLAKKIVFVIAGALAAALLCACVFMPSLSVPLLPVVCALLAYLSMCAGAWIFLPFAAAYCVAGFAAFGFCEFTVAGAVLLSALCVPVFFKRKLSPLVQTALCAGVGAFVVCAVFAVFAIAMRVSVSDVIRGAYEKLSRDPVVRLLSKRHYATLSQTELGHSPYSPADPLYLAEAISRYAEKVWRELDGTVLWYLSGFGAFAGGAGALGGFALSERVCGVTGAPVRDWRLGRVYLLAAVLPALAFAFLAFYEPTVPVVIAVVNLAVTLPSSLCGITLLYHTLTRPKGKVKIATTALFWVLLAVAALFYEWGMLALGFIGLADCVADFRKLLDWALE